MIARKSDGLRAQEVLEAISETNERIKAFDITEDQFLHANDVQTRALADSLLMCALRVTEEAGKLSERSQHGMSLRHAEALSMSDAITTAKLIIKQQAYESGCHASFMPKPLAGEDGSAMFLCQSLFDHDGNNVFWGEDDEKYHLSDIAKHYMAGILAHAREISAITNPTVNSYKRITTGGDSVPQYATWGLRNRASMVRIPVYKPGKQLSTRIELRSPDPMANPYLVNAVTLAAGLDGIERKLELPPEATAETLKLTDRQMVEAGYTPLPRSLKEALDVFEDSQFMKDALGEHIHSFFLKKKRDEWHKFESTITEWEIKHYLANS